MTDASASTNGAPAGTAEQPQQAAAPSLPGATQYVKDLAFENPNAPRSLAQQGQPLVSPRLGSVSVAEPPPNECREKKPEIESRVVVCSLFVPGFIFSSGGEDF